MTGAPRAGLEIKLRSLKLPAFVAHHGEVAGRAETGGWPFDGFLDALADLELEERTRRRIARVQKASHLPADKTLATLDLARLPPAVKRQVPTLCEGGFIERAENLLAFGLPGRGKTHLLAAIGHELVQRGHDLQAPGGLRRLTRPPGVEAPVDLPAHVADLAQRARPLIARVPGQALGEGQQLVGVAAVLSQDVGLGHGRVDLAEHPEIGGDQEDRGGQDGHAHQPEPQTQGLPPPYLSCHFCLFQIPGAGVNPSPLFKPATGDASPASRVSRGSLRSASPERTMTPSGLTPRTYARPQAVSVWARLVPGT